MAGLHPSDDPRLHWRDRKRLIRSLDRRQRDPIFELDAVFPPISKLLFRKNFVRTYGVVIRGEPVSVDLIIDEIGYKERGSAALKLQDYSDFMQAFFPIIHQSSTIPQEQGYKPSELGEIFDSNWWKGNMDAVAFNEFLKGNPNTAYARRSESDRSAFVIGFDEGRGNGPKLTKFLQSNNKIVVTDKNGIPAYYRSIETLYAQFATDLRVKRPAHSETYWPHHWGKAAGAPLPAIDFDAHREKEEEKEEADWSRWTS